MQHPGWESSSDARPLNTRVLGEQGEHVATQFLEKQGYVVVARNYRTRVGEIDLVMVSSQTLVFVEVKWRRQRVFGAAVEAVDERKRRRLVYVARHFWSRYPQHRRPSVRFDVIAIEGGLGRQAKIDWFPNAFSADM